MQHTPLSCIILVPPRGVRHDTSDRVASGTFGAVAALHAATGDSRRCSLTPAWECWGAWWQGRLDAFQLISGCECDKNLCIGIPPAPSGLATYIMTIAHGVREGH